MKPILKLISIIITVALALALLSSCIVIEKIDGEHIHNTLHLTESDGSESTCTEAAYGYIIEKCTECDTILSRQYVKLEDALGHSFSGGSCIRCGTGSGSVGLDVVKNKDGGYTVVGIGDCTDTYLTIEAYGDKPITAIADGAFEGCASLKGVTIGSMIKEIGEYAFSDCKNLTSVEIGGAVVSIGANAFSACQSLGSITVPSNVQSIGASAFFECTSLLEIRFEGTLSELGRDAFGFCRSLTGVELPEGISRINAYTFRGCSNLKYITVPSSVTSVGEKVFDGCDTIREIRYPGTKEDWDSIVFDTPLPSSIALIVFEYQ